MPFVAVDVFDEDGIHSISRRAPLVFREEPRRCPRQFFAAVQDARTIFDEAVDQCSDRANFGNIGGRVAYANLEGPKPGRGANIPADLIELRDDSGLLHVLGIALKLFPPGEELRNPSGRQLLEDHRAVVAVPRIRACPVGRRGRECLEPAKVSCEEPKQWKNL